MKQRIKSELHLFLSTHSVWAVSVNAVRLVGCVQCNAICSPAVFCPSVCPLSCPPLSSPSISQPLASQGIPFLNKSIQLINTTQPFTPFGAPCKTAAVPGSKRHLKTGDGHCEKTKNMWETNSDDLNRSLSTPWLVCNAAATCNKPKGKQKWGWHSSRAQPPGCLLAAFGQGNSELMTVWTVLAFKRWLACTWLQLLRTLEGTTNNVVYAHF